MAVIDNFNSNSATDSLSAGRGKNLNDRLTDIEDAAIVFDENIGLNIIEVESTDNSVTVNPNTYTVIKLRTNDITININNLTDPNKVNVFYFEFDVGNPKYNYTFVCSDTIRWKVSSQPNFMADNKYVLKIVNGLGSYEVWN